MNTSQHDRCVCAEETTQSVYMILYAVSVVTFFHNLSEVQLRLLLEIYQLNGLTLNCPSEQIKLVLFLSNQSLLTFE